MISDVSKYGPAFILSQPSKMKVVRCFETSGISPPNQHDNYQRWCGDPKVSRCGMSWTCLPASPY
jgi:hypothetical protein